MPAGSLELPYHVGSIALAESVSELDELVVSSDHIPFVVKRDTLEYVAGAFAMRGGDTLYGRHWGCSEHFKQLHFELCYYQTIDYCIRENLVRLDAGAQGEHKISRGFEPIETWSAHWIADERFRVAITDYVQREERAMTDYAETLREHIPYRK